MFWALLRKVDKDGAFDCMRLGKHIVQDAGHKGSEQQAGLATAAADLDHHDVSLSQRDDKSSDIRHDRQRTVSGREMAKPDP